MPVGVQWYRKRHYFPLKERSSGLTALIMLNFTLLFCSYPLMMLFYKFRGRGQDEGLELAEGLALFRAMIITQEAFTIVIYLLRSSRIVFAHRVKGH